MSKIKLPKFSNSEKTRIDCQVEHEIFGWIPFTASPEDLEEFGRKLYAALLAGDHGPIADYTPPPKPTLEQLAAAARKIRNEKLAELDGLTVPLRWETYTEARKEAYRSYRIALLNVPTQPKFPEEIDWPIKP
jgi:hypothetical protein